MRNKFKVIKSIITKEIFLRYKILSLSFSKTWDIFLSKINERFHVLIVPHDEKNIIKFTISKSLIFFFIILFFATIITSAQALRKNELIVEKEKNLKNYKTTVSELIKYKKNLSRISKNFLSIQEDIDGIYSELTGFEDKNSLVIYTEYDSSGNSVSRDLKEMDKLRETISDLSLRVHASSKFLKERDTVSTDMPVNVPINGFISSLYGWRFSPFGAGKDFHSGIDIAADEGTPIKATAPGVVTNAGWSSGYGILVSVQHKYGFLTYYGHCSSILVKTGDHVNRGQIIGYVGQTGASTGNHCHYEIRLNGKPINPYQYMSTALIGE